MIIYKFTNNIKIAARALGISRTSLGNVINGLARTAGGYIFKEVKNSGSKS